MANANKTNKSTATVASVPTEPTMSDKIAALHALRAAMGTAGLSTAEVDSVIERELGPGRDDAHKGFMEGLFGTVAKLPFPDLMKDASPAYFAGETFLVAVTFDNAGSVSTVLAKRYAPISATKARKVKADGSATRTKAPSRTAGKVLVVNGEAFKNFNVLATRYGVFKSAANNGLEYDNKHKSDPAKFPAYELLDETAFFASPQAHAPKGYFIFNAAKEAVLTEPVR